MKTENPFTAACDSGLRFHSGRQREKEEGECHAADGIAYNHHAVRLQRRKPRMLQNLREKTAAQRTGRRRERARKIVPGESTGAAIGGNELRQGRLLEGEERSDLVAAGTHNADDAGY